MNEEKKINLAFLGCGFAAKLHSKTLAALKLPVNRFYTCLDVKNAQDYNTKFSGVGTFESYDAAIAAENIDAVLIATPPVAHLELTLKALQAGKHVIVEKPPYLKSSDFDQIKQEQQKAGKLVMVAENYFYKPALLKLQELLKSNVIGEILFVHINAMKEQKIKGWRGDLSLSGGGALFEGGIHWVNFISNLGIELKAVHGFRPGEKTDFDKSMMVSLQYQNGAVGSFYYSWETPSLFKGLRISKIYGKEGSITFESNGIFIIVRGRKKQVIFPGLKDIAGYKGMFVDFIDCIQNNKQPKFNLDLAKQDLLTIEKIYETANEMD